MKRPRPRFKFEVEVLRGEEGQELRLEQAQASDLLMWLHTLTPETPTQGSRVKEIQQISNRRAPKWNQEGLNEATRKVALNCEDTRLRW